MMHLTLTAAVAGALLVSAAPAYADDCERLFGGQSPLSGQGWEMALWDFAFESRRGNTDAAPLRVAFDRFDGALAAFDPIKPGRLDDVGDRIANLEGGVTGMQICNETLLEATGQSLLTAERAAAWRARLDEVAAQFLAVFGDQWEAALLDERRREMRRPVYLSPQWRQVIGRTRPAMLTRLDTMVLASPDGQELAATRDQRLAYAAATSTRQLGRTSLPERAGLWNRVETYSYQRTAGPVTAVLSCAKSFGGGGGLDLSLKLEGGDFVSEDSLDAVQWTTAWLTINGRKRSFAAPLVQTGSDSDTRTEINREIHTTTTYYDTTRAFFSMNSPQMLAQQQRNVGYSASEAAAAIGKGLAKEWFGIEDDGEKTLAEILMESQTEALATQLEANPAWNVDIDEVRDLPSLEFGIETYSHGRLELFDLQPTQAPFRSLMDACWG